MNTIKLKIKEKLDLSSYQMAQLSFLFKTVSSELSKMIIMGVLFHRDLPQYLFILFVMVFLRTISGGLHFYTYAGCFLTSIIYIGSVLWLAKHITLPLYLEMALLLFCILVCYFCGPVTSKYRPPYSADAINNRKRWISLIIFVYFLLLYMIPQPTIIQSGFWVIILHAIQLVLAKIIKKGGQEENV